MIRNDDKIRYYMIGRDYNNCIIGTNHSNVINKLHPSCQLNIKHLSLQQDV
jgi:hypothetical protein